MTDTSAARPTPARPTPTTTTSERLALVLDVTALDEALALAGALQPWFGVAKVGLELFTAAGPTAVHALQDMGFRVFLDLKLHDIPTTVGRAAAAAAHVGADYLTVHTAGGVAMLEAAVDGFGDDRCVLGVTVLTSDVDTSAFGSRLGWAMDAGCGGVVCSAHELSAVARLAPGLTTVVPGIRLAGDEAHDQARVATPASAIAAGASLLVIGRTVTHAPDPARAAAAVHADVEARTTPC